MKKLLAFTILLLFSAAHVEATHIRAGDISMSRVQTVDPSILTYRIITTLYRDGASAIEFEGTLDFGDGNSTTARARKVADVSPQVEQWQIVVEHTFPSDGVYRVSYFEQNRNNGIQNMSNSVNTPFFIESIFLIDQSLGLNDSPILNIPPIDEGVVGQQFTHNPGAFDAQGDSLSYRITVCKRARETPVDNYNFPDDAAFSIQKEDGTTPPIFSIDPINGDLIWDAPNVAGEYNVAFYVDEWRDGVRIGSVNRDMQIIIREHQNQRPNVTVPAEICIVGGEFLADTIYGEDPDQDGVLLSRQEGNIFDLVSPSNPATFTVLGIQPPNGLEKGLFEWQTTCFDVREQPYYVTFKAEDNRVPSVRLAHLETWAIKVVGPPPENLAATPSQTEPSITLQWDNYACGNAETMTIWRRKGSLDLPLDTCVTGVQGYTKVGEVPINTNTFIDTGMERGFNYCYRIYAEFPTPKGGESLMSNEACAFIESPAPYMLNVSVDSNDGTSDTDGKIFVKWSSGELDPLAFPPPITYDLERSDDGGANFAVISTALTDTSFNDTGLNTLDLTYNYRVQVRSQGNVVDTSAVASSVRLTATPRPASIDLDWTASVPWNNLDARFPYHYIYRAVPVGSENYVLIDSVNTVNTGFRYKDDGTFNNEPLSEDEEYCYYITTKGGYDGNLDIEEPLLNNSQKACAIVQDSIPPCPPILTLAPFNCAGLQEPIADQTASCDNIVYSNAMSWVLGPEDECDNSDIVSYNLYYAPYGGAENLQLLADGLTEMEYLHESLLFVTGCYAVTAVDDFGNESELSNIECITENCPFYELPNVFTPNNDGSNDLLKPFRCPRFVQKVVFKAYNRWGVLVYEDDTQIEVNWDGSSNNGSELPTGVYYYLAEVTFYSTNPNGETVTLNGVVHLLRDQ